jgi:hypothetical protein
VLAAEAEVVAAAVVCGGLWWWRLQSCFFVVVAAAVVVVVVAGVAVVVVCGRGATHVVGRRSSLFGQPSVQSLHAVCGGGSPRLLQPHHYNHHNQLQVGRLCLHVTASSKIVGKLKSKTQGGKSQIQ